MRLVTLILVCCMTIVTVQAQRVTRTYRDVSLAVALRQLASESRDYTIYFLYNDLEDFTVTTSVSNKTVPDAIRQMIGFYPISMTCGKHGEIYVECTHKTERRLKGVVVDEHNQPMPYANVALLNPADSAMVGGGVTGESGRFVIPIEHGKVIARITYVGYKPAYRLCSRDNVGTIKMQPDITALKETVITAAKMQIERDGANYTLRNLGGTVMGNAGNAMDLLRWTPGVVVGMNDDISLLGRDGTTEVYINNRKIVNNSELKAINSQDIKRVEVIREPDAQYSSHVASAIRLYTHSPINDNLGASLMNVLEFKREVSNATSLTLDGKYKKLSGNVSLGYNRYNTKSSNTQYTYAQGRGLKNDTTRYSGSGDEYHLFVGFNYALTPRSVLGLQYNGLFSKTGVDLQVSRSFDDLITDVSTTDLSAMKMKTENNSFSASYLWQRNDDSRLLLTADYATSFQASDQEIRAKNAAASSATTITYYNDYTIATGIARYDFATDGWRHKAGVEGGYANNFSQVDKLSDTQRCDRYNYWAAAYYTLDKRWNHWRLSAGLRYEFDRTHTIQDAVIFYDKNYHDVLPNVQVGYRVNDDLDLSASYRRTLVRPSYNQLRSTYYYNVLPYRSYGPSSLSGNGLMITGNPPQAATGSNNLSPNVIYSSSEIATGNPQLLPTVTDRIALTAQYRQFTAQLSYRIIDNAIQTTHLLYTSGTLCQSPVNISRMQAWTLDLDYTYSNRRFNMFLLATATLPRIIIPLMGQDRIERTPQAVLHCNMQYNVLPHVMLGCNVWYSTPWNAGYTRYNSIIGLNLSLMATLCRDRLTLGCNFNDAFNRGTSTRSQTRYMDVLHRTEVNLDSRGVSFMLRWTFNTISNPFKRHSGNDATLQRTQETVN